MRIIQAALEEKPVLTKMNTKKPVGIIVFGVYALLISVLGVVGLYMMPFISCPNPPVATSTQYKQEIPYFVYFALFFVGSMGVLLRRNWGRILIVVLSGIWLVRILYDLYMFVSGKIGFEPIFTGVVINFVFPILFSLPLVLFFTRHTVKAQFFE